jgi:hypothetical protein
VERTPVSIGNTHTDIPGLYIDVFEEVEELYKKSFHD